MGKTPQTTNRLVYSLRIVLCYHSKKSYPGIHWSWCENQYFKASVDQTPNRVTKGNARLQQNGYQNLLSFRVTATVRSPLPSSRMDFFELYLVSVAELTVRNMPDSMWPCLSTVLNLGRKCGRKQAIAILGATFFGPGCYRQMCACAGFCRAGRSARTSCCPWCLRGGWAGEEGRGAGAGAGARTAARANAQRQGGGHVGSHRR